MFRKRRYIFIKRSNRKAWIALLAIGLAGAGALLLLGRSSVQVTARTDTSGDAPVLEIAVEGPGTLRRFDLPPLNLSAPVTDGRGILLVRMEDLPSGTNEIAYILRETWFLPDRHGVLSFERSGEPVNYVARVEPDGAEGASLTLTGDPGNHVFLIDARENILLSGRFSEVADANGIARVTFSKASLNATQSKEGTVTARLRMTSPGGEVDEREVILRAAPPNAVNARVVFPPPGTETDRRIVRVRILTEPKAIVRFGDDPEAHPGPRVEYDWRLPGQGRQFLNFEARVDGLRPKSGTIEIKSNAAASEPATAAAALESSGATNDYAVLAAEPEKHTGTPVALAGKVMAPPAAKGGTARVEIGSGEEAVKGEVAVVCDKRELPSLRKGDRIIARGTMEGPERVRTASGWLLTVPKVRADEFEMEPRTAGREKFRERYAETFTAFWGTRPSGLSPTQAEARPDEILASTAPWPETPETQTRVEVVASEFVSGTGDQRPPEAGAPLPEQMAGAEEFPSPDAAPSGPASDVAAAGPPTEGPAPSPTGAAAAGAPAPEETPPAIQPAGGDEPPPTLQPSPPPSAPPPARTWGRDRALESEVAGRGVTGVRIYRKGRSIRLRGTVASDRQLRTLYQFVNDKGFGEVDYQVEIR
jgi:hypothetical protein